MAKNFTELKWEFKELYNEHKCKNYLTYKGKKELDNGENYCAKGNCIMYKEKSINGFHCVLCQTHELIDELARLEID